jgi:signal-transduction protein with cAMP-binding, CBS, and nucleotidyltransferase domain
VLYGYIDRKHYQKVRIARSKDISVYDICQKEYKNEEDRLQITEYLYTLVPFFRRIKQELVMKIAKHVTSKSYVKLDTLVSHRKNSSTFFVLFKGKVSQMLSSEKNTPILLNSAFGVPLIANESKYDYKVVAATD